MKKYILIAIIIGVGFGIGAVVYANQSFFVNKFTSSGTTDTTTINYMTPGTGTTTITYDTYLSVQGGIPNNLSAAATLALGIQFHASSSNSILAWRYEYSTDNIDWYSDDAQIAGSATTSPTYAVKTFSENYWSFATSTGGTSQSDKGMKLVRNIPTPTRYIRVVFYVPAGSANAAVWGEFLPKKEFRN